MEIAKPDMFVYFKRGQIMSESTDNCQRMADEGKERVEKAPEYPEPKKRKPYIKRHYKPCEQIKRPGG